MGLECATVTAGHVPRSPGWPCREESGVKQPEGRGRGTFSAFFSTRGPAPSGSRPAPPPQAPDRPRPLRLQRAESPTGSRASTSGDSRAASSRFLSTEAGPKPQPSPRVPVSLGLTSLPWASRAPGLYLCCGLCNYRV